MLALLFPLTDWQPHHYCEYLKSGFFSAGKKKKKQIKKDYGLHVWGLLIWMNACYMLACDKAQPWGGVRLSLWAIVLRRARQGRCWYMADTQVSEPLWKCACISTREICKSAATVTIVWTQYFRFSLIKELKSGLAHGTNGIAISYNYTILLQGQRNHVDSF